MFISLLLLCHFYTAYVIQLWNNLKKHYPNIRISLLTSESARIQYLQELTLENGEEIFTVSNLPRRHFLAYYVAIRQLPHFDIIQPLWLDIRWGVFAGSFKNKAEHIYISVGGSDVYRQSKNGLTKYYQKRLIKRASVISSETSQTRELFYETYGEWTRAIPHHIVRFGVDVIDSIKRYNTDAVSQLKAKWNIPPDKTVVMLGYNGSKEHQHLAMICAIEKLLPEALDKCFFIIPMTYGVPNEAYRLQVEESISRITDRYMILDTFLRTDQMAEITIVTDIMLHMQTTDQLSSTMMAHLFQGNVVLAGSWLPYSDLKEKGILLFDVDDFHSLVPALNDVVQNVGIYKKKCEINRIKVYEFSSWEYCIKGWYSIYEALTKRHQR